MIIIRCPLSTQGGFKTQNGRFPSKIALRLKKVCWLFSTPAICDQRQSYKVFIGLTIRAKMIGRDPFYLKFCVKLPRLEQNRRFSIYFRS